MEAEPLHRYLLIEPYEPQEEARDNESGFEGFLIPEDFYKTRHKMGQFELVKIKEVGPKVEADLKRGDVALVETAMIENHISSLGQSMWIAENYIILKYR